MSVSRPDAIIRVNDQVLTDISHDEALSLLLQAGPVVSLTLKHYKAATPFLLKQFGRFIPEYDPTLPTPPDLPTSDNLPSYSYLILITQFIKDLYCENDRLVKTKTATELYTKCLSLATNIAYVECNAAKYDNSVQIETNGYRFYVKVTDQLVSLCVARGQETVSSVSNVNHVKTYLYTWTAALDAMDKLVKVSLEIMQLDTEKLFPDLPNSKASKVQEISEKLLHFDNTAFYGELVGFHLKGDIQRILKPLLIAMAFFSEFVGRTKLEKIKKLTKLRQGFICATTDKELAKKVILASRLSQVDYVKGFFTLTENPVLTTVKPLPKVFTSCFTQINYEQLETQHTNIHSMFKVPIPSSHIDKKFVNARFVSNYRTKQMLGSCQCIHGRVCRCKHTEAGDVIIFHVHGGGFVSQASESHLDYLHQYSERLNVPILSIDYSLAPEAPFPRALEEVFYCYVWMLKNFSALGTSGKKVILVGDSAGGNLITSLTLKTIANCIRIPDGLMPCYSALLTDFYPSPSRLMMMMDPILMTGFMVRCLNAYTDPTYLRSLPRTLEKEVRPGHNSHYQA